MNCKVIATSFNERGIREPHQGVLEYPDHYQSVRSPDDAVEVLAKTVSFEEENDPGAPCDVIIVNSDTGHEAGNAYVRELDGRKIPGGVIRTFTRPNVGWSFGAYNAAYKKFRKDYRYWLFTEDDILVGGRDYYGKAIEKFLERDDTGFVALVGVMKHRWGTHAGGGVGLTHRSVLEQLDRWNGRLAHWPFPPGPESRDAYKNRVITYGEVKFTNEIARLGLKLVDFSTEKKWGFETRLCVPFFHQYPK